MAQTIAKNHSTSLREDQLIAHGIHSDVRRKIHQINTPRRGPPRRDLKRPDETRKKGATETARYSSTLLCAFSSGVRNFSETVTRFLRKNSVTYRHTTRSQMMCDGVQRRRPGNAVVRCALVFSPWRRVQESTTRDCPNSPRDRLPQLYVSRRERPRHPLRLRAHSHAKRELRVVSRLRCCYRARRSRPRSPSVFAGGRVHRVRRLPPIDLSPKSRCRGRTCYVRFSAALMAAIAAP